VHPYLLSGRFSCCWLVADVGATKDEAASSDKVHEINADYGIEKVIFGGHRGMLAHRKIDALKDEQDLCVPPGSIEATICACSSTRLISTGPAVASALTVFPEQRAALLESSCLKPLATRVLCAFPLITARPKALHNRAALRRRHFPQPFPPMLSPVGAVQCRLLGPACALPIPIQRPALGRCHILQPFSPVFSKVATIPHYTPVRVSAFPIAL